MKFATVFVLACAALAKAATTGNTTAEAPAEKPAANGTAAAGTPPALPSAWVAGGPVGAGTWYSPADLEQVHGLHPSLANVTDTKFLDSAVTTDGDGHFTYSNTALNPGYYVAYSCGDLPGQASGYAYVPKTNASSFFGLQFYRLPAGGEYTYAFRRASIDSTVTWLWNATEAPELKCGAKVLA